MRTNFKDWLFEVKAPPGPASDLIGDLRGDDELPDNIESAAELTRYLKSQSACSGALEAVPKVWSLYQLWLRGGRA